MRKFLVSIFTEEWRTWKKIVEKHKHPGVLIILFYMHATFVIVVFSLLNLQYQFQLSLEFWLRITTVCTFPCGCWHRTSLRNYSIIFHWVPVVTFQHLLKAWMSSWTRALYVSLAALLATVPLTCWQVYLIHQLLFLLCNFFTSELLGMLPANISRVFFGHIFQNAVFIHDLSIQKFLEVSQVKQINKKSFLLLETKVILLQCLSLLPHSHIFDSLFIAYQS